MIKKYLCLLVINLSCFATISFAANTSSAESSKRSRTMHDEEIHSRPQGHEVPNQSMLPYETVRIDNKEVFRNKNGHLFYGSAKNVPVALDLQRDQMWTIIDSLYTHRSKIQAAQFDNALLSIRALYTLLTENHQICLEAWSRFVLANDDYRTYSADPRIKVHPNDLDIPVQDKAKIYFETLHGAFVFAQQKHRIVDFFNHAFEKLSSNSICLRTAYETQKRWLEAANR